MIIELDNHIMYCACRTVPFEERIITVLSWLDAPSDERYKHDVNVSIPHSKNGNGDLNYIYMCDVMQASFHGSVLQ